MTVREDKFWIMKKGNGKKKSKRRVSGPPADLPGLFPDSDSESETEEEEVDWLAEVEEKYQENAGKTPEKGRYREIYDKIPFSESQVEVAVECSHPTQKDWDSDILNKNVPGGGE